MMSVIARSSELTVGLLGCWASSMQKSGCPSPPPQVHRGHGPRCLRLCDAVILLSRQHAAFWLPLLMPMEHREHELRCV